MVVSDCDCDCVGAPAAEHQIHYMYSNPNPNPTPNPNAVSASESREKEQRSGLRSSVYGLRRKQLFFYSRISCVKTLTGSRRKGLKGIQISTCDMLNS